METLQHDSKQAAELVTEKDWPESNNVSSTKYLSEERALEVTFKNNSTYQYKDFPPEAWLELLKAPSIGSFLSKSVKGRYGFVQIR